jgi:hypothetical protein
VRLTVVALFTTHTVVSMCMAQKHAFAQLHVWTGAAMGGMACW